MAGFGNLRPATNITPFTYRDGTTLLDMVYQLKDHIEKVIVPAVENHGGELVVKLNEVLDNMAVELSADREIQAGLYNEFTGAIDSLVKSINNKTGAADIQRIRLTAPYTLNINPTWPSNQPVHVTFTQDATGGRTVTLGANITGPLSLNTTPNAVTEIRLVPDGAGKWQVWHPVTRDVLTTSVAALVDAISVVRESDAKKIPATELGKNGGVATLNAAGIVPATQLPPEIVPSMFGTYAVRPAANTVKSGIIYFATDTQEGYRSNGTEWTTITNGGGLLGMAEMFGSDTTTTTKNLDQLVITFRPGTRPVEIGLYTDLANSEYGGTSALQVLLDGDQIFECVDTAILENRWVPVSKATFRTLKPGQAYTVRARLAKTWGDGIARMDGNSAKPTVLYVKTA